MKVLLVDDTKSLLSLVQVYLMGWGLEFALASDGIEALGKAQLSRPDLVISDIRMPRMDGFEMCAAFRGDPELRAVPVVLLTSLNDDATRQKGKLLGAAAFLTKPISVEALRGVVARLLGLPGARR